MQATHPNVDALARQSRLPQPIRLQPQAEPTDQTRSFVKNARGIISALPVMASNTVASDRLDTASGAAKLRASWAMGWQQKRRVADQADRLAHRLASRPDKRPVASRTSSAAAACCLPSRWRHLGPSARNRGNGIYQQ